MEERSKKKTQVNDIPTAFKAAGIAIVFLMTFFGISAFLRVNNIVVEGTTLYSAEQIVEATGISKGDSLFYINRRNVEKKIKDQLPYISTVSIKSDYPETLIINVTESKAVAYLPFAGDALIIDASGRVLDIVKLIPGIPVELAGNRITEIRGIAISSAEIGKPPQFGQGSESNFNIMKDFLTAFTTEALEGMIDYLDIGNITNISFGITDRYKVVVGGTRDYKNKIAQIRTYMAELEAENPNARGTFNMTDPLGEYRFVPYDN